MNYWHFNNDRQKCQGERFIQFIFEDSDSTEQVIYYFYQLI